MEGFGKGMTPREAEEHILSANVLYLGFVDDMVVGFASLNFNPDHAYLAGTVVRPGYRERGIYHEFAFQRIVNSLERGHQRVVARTQNPNIELILRESLEKLVAKKVITGYNFGREKVDGVYGRRLTDNIPSSKNPEVNSFYAALNYDVGDAFKLNFDLKR